MVVQVEAVGEALRAEMLAGIPARDLAVATRVLERVGALLAADAGADDDAAGAA
jgi:hypothetical protein